MGDVPVAEVFGRDGCVACGKAKGVLLALGVKVDYRPVVESLGEPEANIVENLADFHYFDGDIDNLPLVLLWRGGMLIGRWTGVDVIGAGESFMAKVKSALRGYEGENA